MQSKVILLTSLFLIFVPAIFFLPGFRRNAGQGADALRIVSVRDNKNYRI